MLTQTNTAKRRKLQWSWRCCWVLGVRNPRSIACEVWSRRFQNKLCISDRLLFIVGLFYVILLLIIPLWRRYMYETWSWHTYSYTFGFLLKTGCDTAAKGWAAREEDLATTLPASICTTPTRYRSSATAHLVVIPWSITAVILVYEVENFCFAIPYSYKFLFTTPVRWAQDLSQPKSRILNNLIGVAPRNPLLQAI